MQFYINAGDGTYGRYTKTLQFVDGNGVTYTAAATGYDADRKTGGVTIVGTNGDELEVWDVDEAGRQIARLLVLCWDQSLVVDSSSGKTLRGDEGKTADVYPPQRRPRIIVENT